MPKWSLRGCASAVVLVLASAAAAPVMGADNPEQPAPDKAELEAQPPLSAHTGESGLPLSAVQQAMDTPHLALTIAVHPETHSIEGLADYTVRALSSLSAVEFDLDPRFSVTAISVNGEALASSAWRNPEGRMTIRLPRAVAKGGEVHIAIHYAGKPFVAPRAPWEGGIVWATAKDAAGTDQPWIATAVQGQGCDLFWPCLDHYSKRVGVLDFTIDVPAPLVAAANGKLIDTREENGRRVWHWRARMPNDYGVSLQIGPYELTETAYVSRFGNTIPLKFWYLPGDRQGAEDMLAQMHDFLDFFESTVGPYPWGDEKVGLVETPHLGMEHQTINAYGNHFKPSPEGYDWLMHHEFSHEWFANQLTNARNADMWLQEGFASYMQPLYLRWKQGELNYHAALWDVRKKVVSKVPLAPDREIPSTAYNDRDMGWGADIYYKGTWILHTLRLAMGDADFYRSMRLLTYGRDDPRPGNFAHQLATTRDYQRIVEQITGRKWGWFFDAYFRAAPLPKLDVNRQGRQLSLVWRTGASQPFLLPVDVQVGDTLHTVVMTDGKGTLELPDADAHYVIDPQAKILRDDPAITRWQAFEKAEDDRKAAEAAKN